MSVAAANYAVNVCNLQDVAAKMVLTVLAWRAPKEMPNEASMTVAMLQERSGLKSRNGVKDALRRLIDAGEIKVLRAGGPGTAAKYQLLRVGQHLEVSASDRSATDPYGSNGDTYGSNGDAQVSASDPYKTNRLSKTINTSADAPAPATSSPSLPISGKAAPKPKKAPAPKFDPASIPLPHGPGLARAWAEFAQHRRELRAPLTPTAAKRIIDDLAAVNEAAAVEALRKSVKHGWRGCFVEAPAAKPTLVTLPPQGQPKQTALERSLAEMRVKYGKEDAA
jgi:hypothetical protein